VTVSGGVLSGFEADAISFQLEPALVEYCHFTIEPVCPESMIVVEPLPQKAEVEAEAVPPTEIGSTVRVLNEDLGALQPAVTV
jgi:hypothetical protein